MRLFLAIQLSPAVREALLTAQDALRRQGRGSFPPPENLHLTLAFLGEAEDPARARAARELSTSQPGSTTSSTPAWGRAVRISSRSEAKALES